MYFRNRKFKKRSKQQCRRWARLNIDTTRSPLRKHGGRKECSVGKLNKLFASLYWRPVANTG